MGFSCLLHFEIVKTNVAYLAQAGGLKSDLASVELKIPQLVVRKNGSFLKHSWFIQNFKNWLLSLLAQFN